MSDSDSDNYASEQDEINEKSIKSIDDEHDDEHDDEPKKPIKPKRVMSEKQLENLKKARQIAFTKLKDKKKETELYKKKQQELKILKKIEKNITLDKKLKDVKNKIIIDKDTEEIEYIKKPKTKPKPKKKKIVYITDSDNDASEEEIIYKKKPKQPKQPKQPVEQLVEELDEEAKQEKLNTDKIVEKHYNDKIALIKKEYLMKSIFHS
jgi:hypothetical protein